MASDHKPVVSSAKLAKLFLLTCSRLVTQGHLEDDETDSLVTPRIRHISYDLGAALTNCPRRAVELKYQTRRHLACTRVYIFCSNTRLHDSFKSTTYGLSMHCAADS